MSKRLEMTFEDDNGRVEGTMQIISNDGETITAYVIKSFYNTAGKFTERKDATVTMSAKSYEPDGSICWGGYFWR
jgi:hypothetical protein